MEKPFNISRRTIVVIATILVSMISSATAFAGEFGATFNGRLTCEYSSWHEGTVVKVDAKGYTVRITKDLLRHAPKKTFSVKRHDNGQAGVKEGDIVLINYWTKPKKIDWTKFPNSFTWGPHVMTRINKKDKTVGSSNSIGYYHSILGWFYWSGRWDARVESKSMTKSGGYCWYAVLPNGKRVLLYDERTHKGLYTRSPAKKSGK